jgi:hypothetical protein
LAEKNLSSEPLAEALGDVLRHPARTLVAAWNWKAAAMSALLRALLFLFTNLHGGRRHALQASLLEAGFAIFASGLMGAITQRLRAARPLWATALMVWLVVPALMSAAQFAVHHLGGTAHVRAGLIASFVFASLASGFTWFAMRRGTLLAGDDASGVGRDARALPRVLADFLLTAPRALREALQAERARE